MQQQTLEALKEIVHNNSDTANELNNQMVKLDVIKGSVSNLLQSIDAMIHKGFVQEPGVALLLFNQIRDNVRLIDMAFNPLSREIQEEVVKANDYASELFDLIFKDDSE